MKTRSIQELARIAHCARENMNEKNERRRAEKEFRKILRRFEILARRGQTSLTRVWISPILHSKLTVAGFQIVKAGDKNEISYSLYSNLDAPLPAPAD